MNFPWNNSSGNFNLERLQRYFGGLSLGEQRDDLAAEPSIQVVHNADAIDEVFSHTRETTFEKILHLEEQSTSYMKQGKFFEAYGLLKNQYQLGPEIHFAPVLIKYYVTLMQTDRADKADKIRNELIALLEEKFGDSLTEIVSYANKLNAKQQYMEALLFYQIALKFAYKEKSFLPKKLMLVQNLSLGLLQLCIGMREKEAISATTVKSYIIPIMSQIKELASTPKECLVDEKILSLIQAFCLHHQAGCFHSIGEMQSQEATLKEAIAIIKRSQGRDVSKLSIYGSLLHNLAKVCLLMNRANDSVRFISQAITAKKKAEDYDSAFVKMAEINSSEGLLKVAQRKM